MDIRTLPFVRFEDNESHCEGLYGFNLGEGVNRVGPDVQHPFIVRHMKIWGTHYAFRPEVPSLLVDDMRIWRAEYGVYHPNYDNHVYRNLYIGQTNTEPFNRGLDDDSVQYGPLTVDGLTFDGIRSGDEMPLIQISDDNPTGRAVSHFRNVKVLRLDRDAASGLGQPRRRTAAHANDAEGRTGLHPRLFRPRPRRQSGEHEDARIASRIIWTTKMCRS